MNSKHIRGDFNFAWPSAEIAVMGPKGAVEKFANPYIAAERGYIDEVIRPGETKYKLVLAYQLLKTKVDVNPKKKHTNIPL